MQSTHADDHVAEFVLELLRSGVMLSDLAANLTETLTADSYPGEDPGAVVMEMVCGTIATVVGSADPREVRRATELIAAAAERTIEHLELACELSRPGVSLSRSGRGCRRR
jgi:hypothetical protein